jgi:hypothetical protein
LQVFTDIEGKVRDSTAHIIGGNELGEMLQGSAHQLGEQRASSRALVGVDRIDERHSRALLYVRDGTVFGNGGLHGPHPRHKLAPSGWSARERDESQPALFQSKKSCIRSLSYLAVVEKGVVEIKEEPFKAPGCGTRKLRDVLHEIWEWK